MFTLYLGLLGDRTRQLLRAAALDILRDEAAEIAERTITDAPLSREEQRAHGALLRLVHRKLPGSKLTVQSEDESRWLMASLAEAEAVASRLALAEAHAELGKLRRKLSRAAA